MINISLTLLPIFLLLVMGNILRRNGFPGEGFWDQANKMVYWILFPALLFHSMSTVELDPELFGDFAIVLLAAAGGAGLFSLLMTFLLRHDGAQSGSCFQGAMRHNTFIAFAVSEAILGPESRAIVAVATAVLVAPTNLFCVSLLVYFNTADQTERLAERLLKEIMRNPLILSIMAGLSVNALGIAPLLVIDDAVSILANASLPVALLCVGAGLRIRQMKVAIGSVIIACIGKLIIFPLITISLVIQLGLTGDAAFILLIYGAIPTSVTAYALAKQLGSNAPVMAGIITIQTLLTVISMPLMLSLIPPYLS